MFVRKKTTGGRQYLQIVENRREKGKIRQQVVATLGSVEDLRKSGQLERLLRSGARFCDEAILVSAAAQGTVEAKAVRRIGPALVFDRLWRETCCQSAVSHFAGARKHAFSLERALFLTVLHRLFGGGSDRAADRWREDYAIDGVADLDLHRPSQLRHDQARRAQLSQTNAGKRLTARQTKARRPGRRLSLQRRPSMICSPDSPATAAPSETVQMRFHCSQDLEKAPVSTLCADPRARQAALQRTTKPKAPGFRHRGSRPAA